MSPSKAVNIDEREGKLREGNMASFVHAIMSTAAGQNCPCCNGGKKKQGRVPRLKRILETVSANNQPHSSTWLGK